MYFFIAMVKRFWTKYDPFTTDCNYPIEGVSKVPAQEVSKLQSFSICICCLGNTISTQTLNISVKYQHN